MNACSIMVPGEFEFQLYVDREMSRGQTVSQIIKRKKMETRGKGHRESWEISGKRQVNCTNVLFFNQNVTLNHHPSSGNLSVTDGYTEYSYCDVMQVCGQLFSCLWSHMGTPTYMNMNKSYMNGQFVYLLCNQAAAQEVS